MKRFLIAVFLLLGAGRAGGQVHVGDTCLTLEWMGYSSNPDSLLLDTCHSINGHTVFWVKRGIRIDFDTDAIPLPWAPADSDLDVTWQAIDTAYPVLRSSFQALETKFGAFTLKKTYPEDTVAGTLPPREFYLILSNYALYDTLKVALDSIQGIFYSIQERPPPHLDRVTSLSLAATQGYTLSPNPVRTTLWVHADELKLNAFDLIDSRGVFMRRILAHPAGEEFSIDVSDLPSGKFSLQSERVVIPFIHIK